MYVCVCVCVCHTFVQHTFGLLYSLLTRAFYLCICFMPPFVYSSALYKYTQNTFVVVARCSRCCPYCVCIYAKLYLDFAAWHNIFFRYIFLCNSEFFTISAACGTLRILDCITVACRMLHGQLIAT